MSVVQIAETICEIWHSPACEFLNVYDSLARFDGFFKVLDDVSKLSGLGVDGCNVATLLRNITLDFSAPTIQIQHPDEIIPPPDLQCVSRPPVRLSVRQFVNSLVSP
jgi:hypothetical protein